MTLRERLSAGDEARTASPLSPEVANQIYQELKKSMHQLILDRIDLERLKRLTTEQFKHELALLIQRIIEEERIVLNQHERHNLVLDVGRQIDAISLRALDSTDAIYPVLQLGLPDIRDGRRLLDIFRSL
ncbi:MAG: hypothetical protein JF619_30720, partial [Massilia sp.]|nr:hypothetical protein [Massilia sp.]